MEWLASGIRHTRYIGGGRLIMGGAFWLHIYRDRIGVGTLGVWDCTRSSSGGCIDRRLVQWLSLDREH